MEIRENLLNAMSAHPNCQSTVCPLCGYVGNRPCNTRKHIVTQHIQSETLKLYILNMKVIDFLTTNLSNIIAQSSTEQRTNTSENIAIISHKEGNRYTDEYMLNIVECIAANRLSINSFIKCNEGFQNVYFNQQKLDTPSYTTVSRTVEAVSRTVEDLLRDTLITSGNEFVRCFDESDGHISIYYRYCDYLNDSQLNSIQNELEAIQGESKEDERKKKVLTRQIQLRCKQHYCCFSIDTLVNLTAEEIGKKIEKIESSFERKPIFTIIDHGSSCIKYVREDDSIYRINCCGHVLNLVSKHFTNNLYGPFDEYVGKVIRKLRGGWRYLYPLLIAQHYDPNYIENYLESLETIINIDADYEVPLISKPPAPCETRWQTVAKAASFIHNSYDKLLNAVRYWRFVDVREENVKATWSDVVDMLEDSNFRDAVLHCNIFFKMFLEPCFVEMRQNNGFGWLFQYSIDWRDKITTLSIPNVNVPPNVFRDAKKAALMEFDKLMSHHKQEPKFYLASLVNTTYASRALRLLFQLPDQDVDLLNFDTTVLQQIVNEETTIFDHPNELQKWVFHFGAAVIDNEIVESGFSQFNHRAMMNRKHRGGLLRLFNCEDTLWKNRLLTDYNEQYHEHLIDVNNECRNKRKHVDGLMSSLLFVRAEKIRKVVPSRTYVNEEWMNNVLYLFRILYELFQTPIWTPSGCSKVILESILKELKGENLLDDDDIQPSNPGTSGWVHIFDRSNVKSATEIYLSNTIPNIVHEFRPATQQQILLCCQKIGIIIEADNISTSSNGSLTTNTGHFQQANRIERRPNVTYKPPMGLRKYLQPETTQPNHTQD